MCIKRSVYSLAAFWLLLPLSGHAQNDHRKEHGGQWFHRFLLETDAGESREGAIYRWDFDGWIGGDENKIAFKSEGERVDGDTHHAEYWVLYSRTASEFWDIQMGVRQDTTPHSTTYFTVGVEGLAPYFFETEAHLFVSDEGNVSLRLRQENEFLLTQRLVVQPYLEASLYANDEEEEHLGAGLTEAEVGLQTRYEFSRAIAPYIDLRYERSFGETANLRKSDGEENGEAIASIGIRLMF